MSQNCVLTPVAFIHTEFPAKFGIPRQAGLAEELRGKIVFEPAFRVDEALRGLEGFSHIWLIWGFSEARRAKFSPTVRPPRLGGNTRMGVFATRSPFRPNGLALSCVNLAGIDLHDKCGPVIRVLGADLMAVHPRAWLRNELEDVEKSYFYNMQNLLPLVKEAERLGCRIGIENLPTYPNWAVTFYSNFPEEHKRLIDDFNSPAVCGVWDFGHAHLATEDQAAAIAVLGSRIKGTHVHDNFRKVDDHLPPTEGEIDWKVMMQALKATGFDGYLTLEVHYYDWLKQGPEAIRDRVRHLYECVAKADEYLQV